MDFKYNAVCLRSVLWRDSDRLVTLFTLENGAVDCVVRGAMSPKSKWRFATEPFTFAEYVLKEKFGKKTLVEATQIDGFYDLRYDIEKLYCASVVLEFLRNNVGEGEKYYDLFLSTTNALKAIEQGFCPYLALIRFLVSALKETGYEANFGECGGCGKAIGERAYYDFGSGFPVCENCLTVGAVEMRKDTLSLLSLVSDTDEEFFKNKSLSTYSPLFVILTE